MIDEAQIGRIADLEQKVLELQGKLDQKEQPKDDGGKVAALEKRLTELTQRFDDHTITGPGFTGTGDKIKYNPPVGDDAQAANVTTVEIELCDGSTGDFPVKNYIPAEP